MFIIKPVNEIIIPGFIIEWKEFSLMLIYFLKDNKSNIHTLIVLISIPSKYPFIPTFGTINIMNNSLITILIIELINVVFVFPSPFSILEKVVDIYIKGHNGARICINNPEDLLWNIVFPISLPQMEKSVRLSKPIIRQ